MSTSIIRIILFDDASKYAQVPIHVLQYGKWYGVVRSTLYLNINDKPLFFCDDPYHITEMTFTHYYKYILTGCTEKAKESSTSANIL